MSDRIKVAVDAVGGTGSTGLNAYVMIEAANLPEPYRSAQELVYAANHFLEIFALGPLGAAAKYGPDVDVRELEDQALTELRDLLSRMPK